MKRGIIYLCNDCGQKFYKSVDWNGKYLGSAPPHLLQTGCPVCIGIAQAKGILGKSPGKMVKGLFIHKTKGPLSRYFQPAVRDIPSYEALCEKSPSDDPNK